MDVELCVDAGFRGRLRRVWSALRIRRPLGTACFMGREGGDGSEHGDGFAHQRDSDEHGFQGGGSAHRAPLIERIEPSDALAGLAIAGLLVYVLVYKMDTATASMLTGFFGWIMRGAATKNGTK